MVKISCCSIIQNWWHHRAFRSSTDILTANKQHSEYLFFFQRCACSTSFFCHIDREYASLRVYTYNWKKSQFVHTTSTPFELPSRLRHFFLQYVSFDSVCRDACLHDGKRATYIFENQPILWDACFNFL